MPGSLGFKYVYSTKHIDNVLKKIVDTGRPTSLSLDYLKKTWLLKNRQYGAVLDLLRDMGFIEGNKPTELYAEYQNKIKSKKVLAIGIKKAYSGLFKAYPTAHTLDRITLSGYLKEQTGAEKSVLDKIVATFQKLISLADFQIDDPTEIEIKKEKPAEGRKPPISEQLIPITMNIQLVLPSDATPEQYDRIFTSIKKNLINK